MTIQELAKQDPREIYDQDVRDVQALLAEANEDVPFNVEGEDQDPESYEKKEDAHLD